VPTPPDEWKRLNPKKDDDEHVLLEQKTVKLLEEHIESWKRVLAIATPTI
jgi:hypothetical protein